MNAEQSLLPGFGGIARVVAPRPIVASPPSARDQHPPLRPYQVDARAAIHAALNDHRSTLLVMATGLGKTQVFGHVAADWTPRGRVLVLAHRDELLDQARRRLEALTGEWVDLEQAGFRASGARIVVASVQTLSRAARLERFPRDAFGLVIVDEAHHAVAKTYRRILDWFDGAKLLGVTATPDRTDEEAMGNVFETVAYRRDIEDGIADGFLCPIRVGPVDVDAIDLAAVRTTAGDLNQGDLDSVMSSEEALHGVVVPTINEAGSRRTIVFTTSVANAHRMAEIFNRYKPDSARSVDGETATDLRRATLAAHKRGDFQFLCNVGVLTEGYDDPAVACVAMARPTKSRALYAQCAGRGLRIHPGKEDCLLLDFSGNSGRHRLVSALDILAGKYSADEVATAKKIAAEKPRGAGGVNAQKALEQAREELQRKAREAAEREAARRAQVKAKKVSYSMRTVDPFERLGISDPGSSLGVPADPEQLATLDKWYGKDVPINCTSAQAQRLIKAAKHRRLAGLCTYRQAAVLGKRGYDTTRMRFDTAKDLMDAIVRNGWRPLDPETSQWILKQHREPGIEG